MTVDRARRDIDLPTVIGLGLLIMPISTMWHEIGGHAATCVALGGRVTDLSAFYVDCAGLARGGKVAVALAGAGMDMVAALLVYPLWRRATRDLPRLILWLIWLSKAMVAAGYLCFSGATGIGDLGPGIEGGIGPLPMPMLWRLGELAVGIALYAWLVRKGIATLTQMIGGGIETRTARRRIAHGYYLATGIAAVVVGLFNPVGITITLTSAAASSFGGLAGMISIGFALPREGAPRAFVIRSHPAILIAGLVATGVFAAVLGPTLRP